MPGGPWSTWRPANFPPTCRPCTPRHDGSRGASGNAEPTPRGARMRAWTPATGGRLTTEFLSSPRRVGGLVTHPPGRSPSCRVGLQADALATNVSCSPRCRESSGERRVGRGVPPPSGVQQESGPICVTGDLPSSISPSPPAAGHNGGRSASSRRGAAAVAVRRPAAGLGSRAGRGRRRASARHKPPDNGAPGLQAGDPSAALAGAAELRRRAHADPQPAGGLGAAVDQSDGDHHPLAPGQRAV